MSFDVLLLRLVCRKKDREKDGGALDETRQTHSIINNILLKDKQDKNHA